jgi:alpha/beta superfamily hydrolase
MENPKKKGRENRKPNELVFQEMAVILSPHGLYGGNRNSKIPLLNN